MKHNQVVGQRQSHHQTYHQRPVSPGDITYVLASLFLSGMRAIPAPQRIQVVNKASPFLARLLYAANVHRVRRIRENLNVVFGSDRPPDIRRLLSVVVWNALITISLPALSQSQIVNLVPIEGISCLDDCLASGRPVLIWCYHYGISPVIVAALLKARGYPIHLIGNVYRAPVAANILRSRYYLQLQRVGDQLAVQLSMIDPRDGVQRRMLDVLRNKECLYVTPDYMIPMDETQSKSAWVVPIDFLGREAYLQTGSLRLAKRLDARVVTVLSTQADGYDRRLVVEPFELPTPGPTPAELQQDLQMCMRRLEGEVLAHPYWWYDVRRDDLVQRLRKPRTEQGRRTEF